MSNWPEYSYLLPEILRVWPIAVGGFHYLELFQQRVVLVLMLGDVLAMLRQMTTRVDAWYLDGFAPARNPDMWSTEVFNELARCSHLHTRFSTYTAAGDVRRGLMAAGFTVEKVAGFASKRDMLRGSLNQPPHAPDHAPWFAVPENNYKTRKIAVIGAGIAGITSAWSLGLKGWQVDLFDCNPDFALSGSGNPAGVVLPRIAAADSSEAEFYATAFLMALRRLSHLKSNHPELIWEQTGVVQLLSSDRLRHQHDHLELAKEYVRSLSAGEATEVAGIQLDADGLLFPLAGWLSPRSLCEVLLQDVRNAVNTRFNVDVTRLERQTDSWMLRDKHQAVLGNYEVVVLANAQSVVQFEQTKWLNVQPARGQISYLPQSAMSQDLKCPVCYDGYVLPASNGCHIVGASFESGNASTDILQAEHEQNLHKLQHYVPALIADKTYHVPDQMQGRAAVRAVTPDRMPLVGAVPDMDYFAKTYSDLQKGRQATKYPAAQSLPGLFVNTGHGARGLTSAFLTAELLASQITNDVVPVSTAVLHALHPARFFIRQSRKGRLFPYQVSAS